MKGLGLGLSIGLNVMLLVVFLFLSDRCGASQRKGYVAVLEIMKTVGVIKHMAY
jgi:hypothetical protein